MTKVVFNACYGGFGLSRSAILLGRALSGNHKWGGPSLKGDLYDNGGTCNEDYGHCRELKRTDPILIRVIEELGEEANGDHADLRIEEIQTGIRYRIDEYDGSERVITVEDYEWEIAE